MRILKKLSIKNKILLGIGLSFIIAMISLLAIIIYQFEFLSEENEILIEEELLEREYDKYEALVKSRAEILSEFYRLRRKTLEERNQEVTEEEMRSMIARLNDDIEISNMYFYIYDLDGNTISLPPNPILEGRNRMSLEIHDRKLLKEMTSLIEKKNGGRISYPYINPENNSIETKYGYLQKIEGTDMFVGSGGYQSSYYSIVDRILAKIKNIRDRTVYLK